MPLWNIYHPVGAYDLETRIAMAEAITALYPMLPKFYVGVVFHETASENFFIGAKPTADFVRIAVDHIARQFPDDDFARKWLDQMSISLAPFTEGLGFRWEAHIDETPFRLWRIQGYPAPLPNSEAERRWKADNAASPYGGEL